MKPDQTWCLLQRPEHYFEILGDAQDVEFVEELLPAVNGVHIFAIERSVLEDQIEALGQAIHPGGMLWISWYKKSAKKETDIDEDVIRAVVLPLGLVDVKVCAVDTDWSALKIVWRKELR